MNVLVGWRKCDFECCLYMICCCVEKCFEKDFDFYVVCLLGLVMIYKGLVMLKDLFVFYYDFVDECM